MNKFKAHKYWLITIFLSLSSVVAAATLTSFSPNTPIKSVDVNANFAALNNAIAALQTQVNGLPTAATVNSLSTTVSNLSTTVSGLSTTVSGHTTSINSLSSTVSSHTTSINSLAARTLSCIIRGNDAGAPWQASCPSPYTITGGGCNVLQKSGSPGIQLSYPASNGTWQCDAGANLDHAYAICCTYQ
jgi:hypothetical protein